MLSRELIDYVCSQHDDSGLIEVLRRLFYDNNNVFTFDVAEAIDNALEARMERRPQPLTDWVNSFSSSQHMLSRFLYARLLVRQGNLAEAIEILQSLVDSSSKGEPFLLLHLVRLLVRNKQFFSAAKFLKEALSFDPPYSFLVKSEKLLQKIFVSGEFKSSRTIRVALLGSSTTSFLAPVIQSSCFKVGIHAEVYEGGYGNFRQDILDPESALYSFKPEAVIILLNHRDLALAPLTHPDTAKQYVQNLRNLWAILQERNPCHLIQVGFDTPPQGSWGCLEDMEPGGRSRIVRVINSLLSEDLPSGVSFFDINRVALRLGDKFHSDVGWYSSKQYPSLEALPLLAKYLVAHLRAAFGYSAKVLVVDLDNTLWGGVIGEDGLKGIRLGHASPEGECYLDLQRYVKELKDRGILLVICSKNNLEDAELPFRQHDSMILHLDDFVLIKANWQDKASNIQEIAEQLSLGLESFVFLDDNPVERAWVHSCLPEVIVLDCGGTPWEMLAALRHEMCFESIAMTVEDAERHQSYKSNIVRKEFEKNTASVEEFLLDLEMVADCGPVGLNTLSRVTQLINKTNQFNLSTQRYTEEQVRVMAEAPDWWTRWFRLKDKFGDHGVVGVIMARKASKTWHVDTWLMSCRVLGRKMEEFMMAELLKDAHKAGVCDVQGEYRPTSKNVLVKDVYQNLGFMERDEKNKFYFTLPDTKLPVCKYICSANPSL